MLLPNVIMLDVRICLMISFKEKRLPVMLISKIMGGILEPKFRSGGQCYLTSVLQYKVQEYGGSER